MSRAEASAGSSSSGADHAAVRIKPDAAQLVRTDDGQSWCKPMGRPRKGCVWDKDTGEWVLVVGPSDTTRKMARLLGETLNPQLAAAAAAEPGVATPRAAATKAAAAASAMASSDAAAGGAAAAAAAGATAVAGGKSSAKRKRPATYRRTRSVANRKRLNYMRSIEAVLGGCFSQQGLFTMQLLRAELPAEELPAAGLPMDAGAAAARDDESSDAAAGALPRAGAAAAVAAPAYTSLTSASASRVVASNARLLLHAPLRVSEALLPTTAKGAKPMISYTQSEDLIAALGVFQHTKRCGFDLRKTLGINLTEGAVAWRLKNLRKKANRPNHYTAFLEERRARAMTCEPYGEGGGGGALVGEARAKEMRRVLAVRDAREELKKRGFDLTVKPARFAMQCAPWHQDELDALKKGVGTCVGERARALSLSHAARTHSTHTHTHARARARSHAELFTFSLLHSYPLLQVWPALERDQQLLAAAPRAATPS